MKTKKIISLLAAFAILFSCFAVPVRADEYESKPNFWSWAFQKSDLLRNSIGNWYGDWDHACSQSSDGRHHASSYEKDAGNGYFSCICSECGERFNAYAKDAYDDYVHELPVNGIDSEGGFLWYPSCDDVVVGDDYSYKGPGANCRPSVNFNTFPFTFEDGAISIVGGGNCFVLQATKVSGSDGLFLPTIDFYYGLKAPCSGSYYPVENSLMLEIHANCVNRVVNENYKYLNSCSAYKQANKDNNRHKVIGEPLSCCFFNQAYFLNNVGKVGYLYARLYFPIFRVVPFSAPTGLTVDSRPAAIYAPIAYTDNSGQVKTTETTIVNETDKSVYNPVTGDTTTYTDWKYDYSSRTYTFSDESGNTSTVRYGDDNIEVVEGGNTYIYNYYMSDSGSGGDIPAPGHKHNYTSSITREATCTTAGVETFTCAECGDTYTKAIPSLGHDWIVKEKVNSEYDENGEETVKGYTIYECSRCGEQKKSTDGSPPDSGGGAGKPSIWSKLGELFGTISGGLIDAITAALGKILDGLIALAKVIGEKLTAIVEMVLGWFDSLPAMFEGFLAFLSTVFGYLPQEIVILMTFGFAMAIFIGIIKIIRR